MTRQKYDSLFYGITRISMTALTAVSFYILREALILKYCAEASLCSYGAIVPTVETVLAAVSVYLIFAFVAAKFRPPRTE